ncbi:LacI family DNA-binding transcriptional regulator [Alkalihalobacterium elongatum]|uniref:LacI family DNA-binding transcriptional regulator n=1 Tax=Alkalihalobacterium elongatum TaxID=2675466 RepID=UPI001C1F42C2|nr:substrate-binding domain-containing protein [Alkalihalobacterium elongatum]
MKPTIKDVAQKANVSIATVSRILNNQLGYSEKTKERVLKVIEELGFRPNAIARGLVSRRTKTIGVLLPNVTSSFASKLLKGIEKSAHENDYSMIVCNTDHSGSRTLDYLNILGEKKVDGLIFSSQEIKEEYYETITRLGIPVILISSMSYRFPLPYVKVDDRQAAYHATSYLIKNGHEKIAMISGDDDLTGKPRMEGYKQAMEDHELPLNEKLIVYGGFDFESGKKCMKQLLPLKNEFTAVFSASDDMAVGAMSAAYENNLKVPDDFSIIGFDNTLVAEMAIPPLTTVAQPLWEMGKMAIEKVIEMIESEGHHTSSSIMNFQIIERKSVKILKST